MRRGERFGRILAVLMCLAAIGAPQARAQVVIAGHGTRALQPDAPYCADPFQVGVRPVRFSEDDSLSIADLVADTDAALSLRGVTLGRVNTRSVVNGESRDDAGGGCRIYRVTLAYEDMVLSVARELQGHPCAYEHVRHHELHHIDIYRNWTVGMAPRLRLALREKFPAGSFTGTATQRAQAVQIGLDLLRAVLPQQHAFDSDEEYAQNATACDRDIAAIGLRAALHPD
jgi:hypothetical protein